jgi:hypothetical protein
MNDLMEACDRNLTAARLPKKALLNTTKVTSWATKYEWSFPTVADALLGALMILVLASDAVKLAIGPGTWFMVTVICY